MRNLRQSRRSRGAQGKFWEMHDYLYEHQSELGPNSSLFRETYDWIYGNIQQISFAMPTQNAFEKAS